MKRLTFASILIVSGILAFGAPPTRSFAVPLSCEELAKLVLSNATITSAAIVEAGAFTPPADLPAYLAGDAGLYKKLQAFCRVRITDKPTTDSDIKIEVWLPASGWNGKFRGQGNGGFAGMIDYGNLALAIFQGYATAGTDTGHGADGGDARWAGAHDSKGKTIFPGFVPGGEEGDCGWPLWITGPDPADALLFEFGNGYFANMVYDKPDWDYKKATLDEAVKPSDEKFANVLNAVQADMKAFKARGGKLIIYQGWSDAAISPLNAINYYESVLQKMGQSESDAFLRLYMVPGMHHCGGGPGPDRFGAFGISPINDPQHNIYLAVENWVEKGKAPGTVIALKADGFGPTVKVTMTRPLCVYPQMAKYKGSGDTNEAANFVCGGPEVKR